jgi:hypothetical protein
LSWLFGSWAGELGCKRGTPIKKSKPRRAHYFSRWKLWGNSCGRMRSMLASSC